MKEEDQQLWLLPSNGESPVNMKKACEFGWNVLKEVLVEWGKVEAHAQEVVMKGERRWELNLERASKWGINMRDWDLHLPNMLDH